MRENIHDTDWITNTWWSWITVVIIASFSNVFYEWHSSHHKNNHNNTPRFRENNACKHVMTTHVTCIQKWTAGGCIHQSLSLYIIYIADLYSTPIVVMLGWIFKRLKTFHVHLTTYNQKLYSRVLTHNSEGIKWIRI